MGKFHSRKNLKLYTFSLLLIWVIFRYATRTIVPFPPSLWSWPIFLKNWMTRLIRKIALIPMGSNANFYKCPSLAPCSPVIFFLRPMVRFKTRRFPPIAPGICIAPEKWNLHARSFSCLFHATLVGILSLVSNNTHIGVTRRTSSAPTANISQRTKFLKRTNHRHFLWLGLTEFNLQT